MKVVRRWSLARRCRLQWTHSSLAHFRDLAFSDWQRWFLQAASWRSLAPASKHRQAPPCFLTCDTNCRSGPGRVAQKKTRTCSSTFRLLSHKRLSRYVCLHPLSQLRLQPDAPGHKLPEGRNYREHPRVQRLRQPVFAAEVNDLGRLSTAAKPVSGLLSYRKGVPGRRPRGELRVTADSLVRHDASPLDRSRRTFVSEAERRGLDGDVSTTNPHSPFHTACRSP